jgi:hypothetical protein
MAAEVMTLQRPASAENGKPSASGAERRVWVRYPCHLDVVYWKSTGSATEACRSARILDISAGGVRMLLNRPFEAGTVLTLQLENAEQTSTRTLLVHVVHVRPHSHSEWVVGCAFDSKVSEEDARALADWSRQASAFLGQTDENGIPAEFRATLTPKQRRAIDALVTLPNLPAAAAAVKVRERTLQSWLELPQFRAALRAARRQAVRAAAGRLQQLSGKAVDLLERHLSCGERAVEIEAALAILQYALQTIQPTSRRSPGADLQPPRGDGVN